MAVKRRRPTRADLDERIRIVLGKIPDVDHEPALPEPGRSPLESGRIVSGTIERAAEAS